jgi:cellulose synthase operon protein C
MSAVQGRAGVMGTRWAIAALVAGAVWGSGAGPMALAQEAPPATGVTAPSTATALLSPSGVALSPLVRGVIDAPYQTAVTRAALRAFHGVPAAEDLANPAHRATVALASLAVHDPSLAPGGPATASQQAQAMLLRGELQAAEQAAQGLIERRDPQQPATVVDAIAGEVIAAEVALARGAMKQATERLMRAQQQAAAIEPATAEVIVLQVRALRTLADLVVEEGAVPGAAHDAMMALLGEAKKLEPFYWPAAVLEAELLADKDNFQEARVAAKAALEMNPRSAAALAVVGELAVNSFDMTSAEGIAAVLDRLAVLPEGQAEAALPGGPAHEEADAQPPAHSLQALLIRVRGRLRQDDVAGAQLAIAAMEDRFASSPVRRAAEIATIAAGYDFAKLDAELARFEQDFGPSGLAHYWAGRVLADLRQYGASDRYLAESSRRQPAWASPLIERGLMLLQAARDEEALEVLRKAREQDPFNVRVSNSMTLAEEIARYDRTESEHFIIRSKGKLDGLVAQEMLPKLEKAYALVTGPADKGGLEHDPAKEGTGKVFVDLMPNHAWFAVRIAGMPRIHTIAASTGPLIAMEAPREGKGHSGTWDWPRVLQHELVHTVGLSKTGNRLPHWFTEAQAQYLEYAPRSEGTLRLVAEAFESDELFDFDGINIAFTRPKKPTDRGLAYAQGHWMYEYIVERFGVRAPLDLMAAFSQGVREADALPKVLGISQASFMTEFRPWLQEKLEREGMLLAAGTPTLGEILESEKIQDISAISEEQAQRLLATHPEHPDVIELVIRRAMREAGNVVTPETAELLEKLAKVRPGEAFAHRQLARYHLGMNVPAKAVEHLRWLDAREDKSPLFASQLADALAATGDLAGAYEASKRAVAKGPYMPQFREQAAALALQNQDLPAARRHLVFLTELEPQVSRHQERLKAFEGRFGKGG